MFSITLKICWNNFQVWVLTKNSSRINLCSLWKFLKSTKMENFKIYFWDEFLLGWVLMVLNDEFDVFEYVLHHPYHLWEIWYISKFPQKLKVFETINLWDAIFNFLKMSKNRIISLSECFQVSKRVISSSQ